MSRETDLIFYIQDHPVGVFQSTDGYPSAVGWHAYEPYRGTGHAVLVQTLKAGEKVTAWFPYADVKQPFEIDKESFDFKRTSGQWQIHVSQIENK